MVAVARAIALVIVLAACLASSCTQHDRYTTVSKPFGLCAKETKGVTYHLKLYYDTQRGTIHRNSTVIGIDIDTYPNIERSQLERVKQQPSYFALFMDEPSANGEETKIYTYKQYHEYVFVQLKFDSRNAEQVALADMVSHAFAPCHAIGQ